MAKIKTASKAPVSKQVAKPAKLTTAQLSYAYADIESGAFDTLSGEARLKAACVLLKQHDAVKTASDLLKVRAPYYRGALRSILKCDAAKADALVKRGAKRSKVETAALKTVDKRYSRAMAPFGWLALSGCGGANNPKGENAATKAAREAAELAAAKVSAEAAGVTRAPRMPGATDKAAAPAFVSGVAGAMLARPSSFADAAIGVNDLMLLQERFLLEHAKILGARGAALRASLKSARATFNAPEAEATPCAKDAPLVPVLIVSNVTRDAEAEAAAPMVTNEQREAHAAQPPLARKSR